MERREWNKGDWMWLMEMRIEGRLEKCEGMGGGGGRDGHREGRKEGRG